MITRVNWIEPQKEIVTITQMGGIDMSTPDTTADAIHVRRCNQCGAPVEELLVYIGERAPRGDTTADAIKDLLQYVLDSVPDKIDPDLEIESRLNAIAAHAVCLEAERDELQRRVERLEAERDDEKEDR